MNIFTRLAYNSSVRAFITLACLVVIINFSFTIKSEHGNTTPSVVKVSSTFYHPGKTNLNNLKDIPLWSDFFTPTIYIASTGSMNFNSDQKPDPIQLLDIPNFDTTDYAINTPLLAESDFMSRHFSLKHILSENFIPYSVATKHFIEPQVVTLEKLHFTSRNGTALLFLPNFKKVKQAPELTQSLIKISKLNQKMPLIQLRQDSGQKKLDFKMMRSLSHALSLSKNRIQLQHHFNANSGELTIDWRQK